MSRDADAELLALAAQGIHLDSVTEKAFRIAVAEQDAAAVPKKTECKTCKTGKYSSRRKAG